MGKTNNNATNTTSNITTETAEVTSAPASPILDASTNRSVEAMLLKLTSPHPKTSPTVGSKKLPRHDVDDCLDDKGQEKKTHPEYKVRSSSPTGGGYSFGHDWDSENKRFISQELMEHTNLGKESPGPCYNPISFTDHPSKAQSFPKSQRQMELTRKSPHQATPGPTYQPPNFGEKPFHRPFAPNYTAGRSQRFQESEFISAAHSKSGISKDSPAPNLYCPEVSSSAPSYSFSSGGRDIKRGKLFVSKTHSEHDCVGDCSPGPCYNWKSEVIHPKSPAFTFGTSDRIEDLPPRPNSTPPDFPNTASKEHRPTSPQHNPRFISHEHSKHAPGKDSPGPGIYAPPDTLGKNAPSFSFGMPDHSTKRYMSKELGPGPGADSPGPRYKPLDKLTRKSVPGVVFSEPDQVLASLLQRFPKKQYLGRGISIDGPGGHSPGPAQYDIDQHALRGPAFSIARKERVLMKRICPAPERPRFFSNELAKENYGTYSPGPKYKLPDLIGSTSSIKYTLGVSDRAFEDLALELREKLGTIAKPYTTPAETRFISEDQTKSTMVGKFSPGPIYYPNSDIVKNKSPSFSFCPKRYAPEKDPPKLSAAEMEEERKKLKAKGPIKEVKTKPPIVKFGTSKRGLLKGEERQSRMLPGRDSPGAVYRPNFEGVDPKIPTASLGGLR